MKKQLYQPYALATVFCWALAFVFTRMTLSYFSAASLGFLRYLAVSAALIVIAGTLMLAFFAPTAFRELSAAPAIQYVYVLLLGIFPSAIAYVSWSVAFSKAERTSQVSNFTVLTLFFTSLLGIVILHETPNTATLVGGSITLAGVLLFNYGAAWLAKRRAPAYNK